MPKTTRPQILLSGITMFSLSLEEQQRILCQGQSLSATSKGRAPSRSLYAFSNEQSFRGRGLELLQQGKAACVILAAGQGSRLGWEGPKALYPISTLQKRTLLEIFLQKAAAASFASKIPLPVAVMVSPEHRKVIGEALERLAKGDSSMQAELFEQPVLPLLNEQGERFLDGAGRIAVGPTGNGAVFESLSQAGILTKWRQLEIEYVVVVQIDNPLSDPFDVQLLGFHAHHGGDATIKSMLREDPEEKVGVVVEEGEGLQIVEYIELSSEQKLSCLADGSLQWPLANAGILSFRFSFLEKITGIAREILPWHLAKKNGCWKFETFLFDALKKASGVRALVYPRSEIYAPLKNKEGDKSPQTVRDALVAYERNIYERMTGVSAQDQAFFELDSSCYSFFYQP